MWEEAATTPTAQMGRSSPWRRRQLFRGGCVWGKSVRSWRQSRQAECLL